MTVRKRGKLYLLFSKTSGKLLGTFRSLKAARERERQIQFFKRRDAARRK